MADGHHPDSLSRGCTKHPASVGRISAPARRVVVNMSFRFSRSLRFVAAAWLALAAIPGNAAAQTAPPAANVTGRVIDAFTTSPLAVRSIAGAAENIFRTIQTLPGVNAADDFGSRLSVRGGGPDQNLTVMDGVEIHDPYRLFGLTSAFNPETVESFEFVAGGFSPKSGDRLSSILLVENRAGTRARPFAGSFSLALTDANFVAEGALPGGGKGSWIVSGRRTYYDLIANRIVGTTLPAFSDVQAKVAYDLRPNQRLSLFVLSSRERTDALFDEESSASSLGFGNEASNNLVSLTLTSTWGSRLSSRTIGPRSATSGRARSLCCRRLASAAGSDQGGEGADPAGCSVRWPGKRVPWPTTTSTRACATRWRDTRAPAPTTCCSCRTSCCSTRA